MRDFGDENDWTMDDRISVSAAGFQRLLDAINNDELEPVDFDIHPNCRCTMQPVDFDMDISEAILNYINGVKE